LFFIPNDDNNHNKNKTTNPMQSIPVDPKAMLLQQVREEEEDEEHEDEEAALLYGNGNPQEDSNEPLPQLRSRKDLPPRNSPMLGDGLALRRERRPRCQRRPNVQCLAVTLAGMTIVSLAVAVVWYSDELFNHGYVFPFSVLVVLQLVVLV
jgi:hypothetical protein